MNDIGEWLLPAIDRSIEKKSRLKGTPTERPLQKAPFAQSQRRAQILTRLRRVNPRNIQYIPAVKIIAFLDLDQN